MRRCEPAHGCPIGPGPAQCTGAKEAAGRRARREDLDGAFVDTSREGFALALDVSAFSLVALVREARPLIRPGSSMMTLTCYGAEKVVGRRRGVQRPRRADERGVTDLFRGAAG
jgi:hypothetical protein